MKKILNLVLLALVFLCFSCEKETKTPDDQPNDPDPDPSSTVSINSLGGKLIWENFTLEVPEGCFSQSFQISLLDEESGANFGENELSPFYTLTGIPQNFKENLRIILSPEGNVTGAVFAVLGENTIATGQQGQKIRFRFEEVVNEGGKYSFEIAPFDEPEYASIDTIHLVVGLVKNHERYATKGHFAIYGEANHISQAVDLGEYLEAAYEKYKSPEMGFDYSRRTNWPLRVNLKEMEDDTYGDFVASKWGVNYSTININTKILSDPEALQTTAGHEFFHMVQSLYDPRNGFIKAVSHPDHYWLEEASSVWAEELFTDHPNTYNSPSRNGYQNESFLGWLHNVENDPAGHGYGMSSLVKYIVKNHGADKIKDIFENIYNGESFLLTAINNALPVTLGSSYANFIDQYTQSQLYKDFGTANLVSSNNGTFEINTIDDILASFEASYEALSANAYLVHANFTGFSDQDALLLKTSNAGKKLVYKLVGSALTVLGTAVGEFTIPQIKQLQQENAIILVIVVNESYSSSNIKLDVKVIRPPAPTWNQIAVSINDLPVVFERLSLPEGTITTYDTDLNSDLRDWSNSGLVDNYVFTATWSFEQFNTLYTGNAVLEFDVVNHKLAQGTFDWHQESLSPYPEYNFKDVRFKLADLPAGIGQSGVNINFSGADICNQSKFWDFFYQSSVGSPEMGQDIITLQTYDCPEIAEIIITLSTFK
jgi:hypothetical protein